MPIPLTVIGGFLGAGKTTLLNRILCASTGVRFAVLVNDFGDLAIDAALVTEHGGDTISFANGCVCCTLGDSLMMSLDRLLERADPPQQILIEASGVADPAAIADIGVLEPRLRRDLVMVLADAETICERARDPLLCDTVERQLQSADMLVLNKCDLLDETRRTVVRMWLEERLSIPVIETEHARIPLELLVADPGDASSRDEPATPTHTHRDPHPFRTTRVDSHHNPHPFRTTRVVLEACVDLDMLRRELLRLPPSVLRAKGFVRATESPHAYYLVQLAGRRVEIAPWRTASPAPDTGLVFVGTSDMPNITLDATRAAHPEA